MVHVIQLLKCWLSDVWLGDEVEENRALSVDRRQLQAMQYSLHLIDLLSILVR